MTTPPCRYQFIDETTCAEAVVEGSGFCFWHDPNSDKSGKDIKGRLEEKHNKGERLEGFQLKGADLDDIYLIRSDLFNVNLTRANLHRAHLFNSNLNKACLFKANLDKANLKKCSLKDAELLGAHFGGAELDNIDLGEGFKLKNEQEGDAFAKQGDKAKAHEKYFEAEEIYRDIKTNFKNRGLSFEGGRYFYREMVMKRKQLPFFSIERFWSRIMDLATGYGEKPYKIIGFSISFMTVWAFIFSFLGIVHTSGYHARLSGNHTFYQNCVVFYDAFYYSVVTFTTLGYGDFTPLGIGKLLAIMESFSGAFLIALFVITMYKRYMER